MTIYRFVKVVSTVALLGFAMQIQAHEDEADSITGMGGTGISATVVDPTLLAALTQNVKDGKISGGLGINYIGKFIFDNKMTVFDSAKGLFGTDLTVVSQPNGFPGFAADKTDEEIISIPPTSSISWNDAASNPDVAGATDVQTQGFGSGHDSSWYLVDLSKLASGKYYVSVKVERAAEGDDFVPALTVFDGYQNRGAQPHWFPNQNQKTTTPFAAEMLKTESVLIGTNTTKSGYDTAFGALDNGIAQVSGVIKLDAAGKIAKTNRYLTIALGGDDRNPVANHDVNYRLTVKVHSCIGAPCANK